MGWVRPENPQAVPSPLLVPPPNAMPQNGFWLLDPTCPADLVPLGNAREPRWCTCRLILPPSPRWGIDSAVAAATIPTNVPPRPQLRGSREDLLLIQGKDGRDPRRGTAAPRRSSPSATRLAVGRSTRSTRSGQAEPGDSRRFPYVLRSVVPRSSRVLGRRCPKPMRLNT